MKSKRGSIDIASQPSEERPESRGNLHQVLVCLASALVDIYAGVRLQAKKVCRIGSG
jgi:hypothetical protein